METKTLQVRVIEPNLIGDVYRWKGDLVTLPEDRAKVLITAGVVEAHPILLAAPATPEVRTDPAAGIDQLNTRLSDLRIEMPAPAANELTKTKKPRK